MRLNIFTALKNWTKNEPAVYDSLKLISRRLKVRTDPAYDFFNEYSKNFDRPVRFLQIGANDGLRNDPVREFIIRDSWKGVFVEPLPQIFDMLKKNYAGYSDLEFVNTAVSLHGHTTFNLWTYSDDFLEQLPNEEKLDYLRKSSSQRDHVARFLPRHCEQDNSLRRITVPCVSINDIYFEYFSPDEMDLLVIDAEGHEKEIIGSIDFGKFTPSTIFFESHNLGAEKAELESMLIEQGYQTIDILGDTVATKL